MAVASETSSVTYTGNNSAVTPYPITFGYIDEAHIAVSVRLIATGALTELAPSAFEVTEDGVVTDAAWPPTYQVIVSRELPLTQPTEYEDGGRFPAASHETALDRLCQQIQQVNRLASAAPSVAGGISFQWPNALDRANTAPTFDADGDPDLKSAADFATWLNLPETVMDRPTKVATDAADRAAAVPDFEGQILAQQDTGQLWIANGTGAGDWTAIGTSGEIETWAVGDGTSTPVSEWLTGGLRDRGYADLTAIQADYPCVVATTDQIDWAVIQNELDKIGLGTRTDRWVCIKAGQFVLNRSLTVKGPNVFLVGQGMYDTVLTYSANVDGLLFTTDTAGRQPHHQRVERLCLAGLIPPASTGVGIVAGKSDKSEDYEWQGITISQVLVQGFATGILGANMPMLHSHSVAVLGCTTCVDLAKCDTFVFLSCIMGNQQGWDGVTTTATDLVFNLRRPIVGGDPGGPGFGGSIIGGEYGNCTSMMKVDGGSRVNISGTNHETFTGGTTEGWCYRISHGVLSMDQCRIAGHAGAVCILVEPGSGESPQVRIEQVAFEGYAGKPVVVKGDYNYQGTVLSPHAAIEWQTSAGAFEGAMPRNDNYVPPRHINYDSVYPATDSASMLSIRMSPYFRMRRTVAEIGGDGDAFPDRLVMPYMRPNGTGGRSDLANHIHSELLLEEFSNNANVTTTPRELAAVATKLNQLWSIGRNYSFEFSGIYANNANAKTLTLEYPTTADLFTTGAVVPVGLYWHIEGKAYRTNDGDICYRVTYNEDGVAPVLRTGRFAVSPTAAGDLKLWGTGVASDDIIIRAALVRCEE